MLTQARLKQVLSYDEKTGLFTRINSSGCVAAGKTYTHRKKGSGYIEIMVDRKLYYAHRLAWLYVNGEWPSDQIDHINRVRHDNRICNLRPATNKQNQRNRKGRSLCGLKGVTFDKRYANSKNPWIASICIDGRQTHLGSFPSAIEAHNAYKAAALKHFSDFARF